MKFSYHQTVREYKEQRTDFPMLTTDILETASLKQMALDAGADDAGFIDLFREIMAQYRPDLHVTADSQTWIKFSAKETNLLIALVTRKIRIEGQPKLMKAFARCFPS